MSQSQKPQSTIIVTPNQRGSTLRLNIAVSRIEDTNTEFTTGEMNAGDLALVVVKCKNNKSVTSQLAFSVMMKKNKNTSKCTVQVTCENYSKPICLSEVWTETVILIKSHKTQVHPSNSSPVLLYTTEVYITVLEETSLPMLVNKQLYQDVESTDFELRATDGSVAVHKAVLFIHSDMFRTMFRGAWKETGEGCVKVDGVTGQTLEHLKDYMYLGTLPDEGLEPLLLFAACYMMDNLKKDCSAKLVKTMKPENFDDIVEFAVQNNIGALVRALIMETTDDFMNKFHHLKINTDKNDENCFVSFVPHGGIVASSTVKIMTS